MVVSFAGAPHLSRKKTALTAKFTFKDFEIEQGDIVILTASSFHFEFQAAVVDYDEESDTLEVMSTQLALTQHNGFFPSRDVEQIAVLHKYDEGVPVQARADLARGQRCVVTNGIDNWNADVIAAYDGIVTGRVYDTPGVEDGTPVSGGSSF